MRTSLNTQKYLLFKLVLLWRHSNSAGSRPAIKAVGGAAVEASGAVEAIEVAHRLTNLHKHSSNSPASVNLSVAVNTAILMVTAISSALTYIQSYTPSSAALTAATSTPSQPPSSSQQTPQRSYNTAKLPTRSGRDAPSGSGYWGLKITQLPPSTERALHTATDSLLWVVDSGCSGHITNSDAAFTSSEPCIVEIQVGKDTVFSQSIGLRVVIGVVDGQRQRLALSNVLYVPGLIVNRLSTTALRRKGCHYRSDEKCLFLRDDLLVETKIASVYEYNNLPYLQLYNPAAFPSSRVQLPPRATTDEWRCHLGHLHHLKLAQLVQEDHIAITGSRKHPRECLICRQAQAHKMSSRPTKTPPSQPFRLVAVDVVTVTYPGLEHERHFTLFTDQASLFRHVYSSEHKNGASFHFRHFHAGIQSNLGIKVASHMEWPNPRQQ